LTKLGNPRKKMQNKIVTGINKESYFIK